MPPILKVRPYRFGSDCEFLFVDKVGKIQPARNLVGPTGNRSFVGHDGHSTTAEIRPRPFFNIKGQLFDLATGLTEAAKMASGFRMVAVPMYEGEPLGGHIHVSGFSIKNTVSSLIPPKVQAYLKDHRFSLTPTSRRMRNEYGEIVSEENLPEYVKEFLKIVGGESTQIGLNVGIFSDVMNYLLLLFEQAIQPQDLRDLRNQRYGGPHDVRIGESLKPKTLPGGTVYWHFEYRPPSTWLIHPRIAYAYIGLAKLTMLNAAIVYEELFQKETMPPENLARRLAVLYDSPKFIITPDLRQLQEILSDVLEQGPKKWFASPFINLEAWQNMLP